MTQRPPLRERKRQRAREAIVDAAFALFAERGFADVTVTEIAERAEVGRTTFFRYFGDKQEVVFADEEQLADELLRGRDGNTGGTATLREALTEARDAVLAMCKVVTADERRYRLHEKLVAENPELHDRGERKLLRLADGTAALFRARGMPAEEATLAAQVSLACYRAGKAAAGDDPAALGPAVDGAFDRLLRLVSV